MPLEHARYPSKAMVWIVFPSPISSALPGTRECEEQEMKDVNSQDPVGVIGM